MTAADEVRAACEPREAPSMAKRDAHHGSIWDAYTRLQRAALAVVDRGDDGQLAAMAARLKEDRCRECGVWSDLGKNKHCFGCLQKIEKDDDGS